MQVPKMLLETLEDLLSDDFKAFQWHLTLETKPIARSHLENKTRFETVDKMIERYGEEASVDLAVKILEQMNMNEAARRLRSRFSEVGAAASPPPPSSSSSSAPLPPPAPTMISAQQGSVVISPNISGSTTGTLNITINKA